MSGGIQITKQQFLAMVQERFGGYERKEGNLVSKYIDQDLDANKLMHLWKYLVYYRKPEYGPPTVAHLEEVNRLGMENRRGPDCHRSKNFTTQILQTLSPEEIAEARAEFEAHGGLAAWWREHRSINV